MHHSRFRLRQYFEKLEDILHEGYKSMIDPSFFLVGRLSENLPAIKQSIKSIFIV